jgi:hypothetical protein
MLSVTLIIIENHHCVTNLSYISSTIYTFVIMFSVKLGKHDVRQLLLPVGDN